MVKFGKALPCPPVNMRWITKPATMAVPYQANEIVAAGTTLPDIDNLSGALALFQGDQYNTSGTHTITFTLTEPTTVAVGWVVHVDLYTYLEFFSIRLRKTE
jgi:hypothetical protein